VTIFLLLPSRSAAGQETGIGQMNQTECAGESVDESVEFERDNQPDLLVLVQNLIAEASDIPRLLEAYYWSEEPGLLELVRAFLALPAEAQTAVRAFFAAAVMRSSITASIDTSGALILRAPEAAAVLVSLFGGRQSGSSH
jgi:hypothetical protein